MVSELDLGQLWTLSQMMKRRILLGPEQKAEKSWDPDKG